MSATDPQTLGRAYIETVSAHDLSPLNVLFDDALVATFSGVTTDKTGWIAALGRLLPALIRNDIREIFSERARACVVYDFVTNTDGGTIRCVELMTIKDGKIVDIELILDRMAFAPVNRALSERAAKTS